MQRALAMSESQRSPILSPTYPTRPGERRVFQSLLILILGVGAVLAFICLLGDIRRQHNAMGQMKWHAATYQKRLGDGATLPLNFIPDVAPDQLPKMIQLEFLSAEESRKLRGSDRPILVAQTAPLTRVLAPDGRGVVIFEKGAFRVEWMDLPQFDRLFAGQKEELAKTP